jgi:predicted RNase H-like HicB family nuclease
MLIQYLKTGLRKAHYEILPDNGEYYGEITECNGVHATASSLEACRDELEEVLEEWILFRLHRNLSLPIIDGVELAVKKEATSARNC